MLCGGDWIMRKRVDSRGVCSGLPGRCCEETWVRLSLTGIKNFMLVLVSPDISSGFCYLQDCTWKLWRARRCVSFSADLLFVFECLTLVTAMGVKACWINSAEQCLALRLELGVELIVLHWSASPRRKFSCIPSETKILHLESLFCLQVEFPCSTHSLYS